MLIYQGNQEILQNLYFEYKNLPWYKKFFFPRNLADALRAYSEDIENKDKAYVVCNTFINHTGLFQFWFFPFLHVFSESSFFQSFKILFDKELLSIENLNQNTNDEHNLDIENSSYTFFDTLLEQPSDNFHKNITMLDNAELLQDTDGIIMFNIIKDYPQINLDILKLLNDKKLLSEEINFAAIAVNANQISLLDCLIKLEKCDLLIVDNINQIIELQSLYDIAKTMDKIIYINDLSLEQKQQIFLNLLANHCFLQAFNILLDNGLVFNYEILLHNDVSQAIIILSMNGKGNVKENLEAFILQPDEFAKSVITLNEQGLLNRGYFLDIKNAYKQQQNISELAEAYVYLDKHHLLNFSNCQALLKNKRPNDVAEAFAVCDRHGLFIGAAAARNREVVACHESPYLLAQALSSLNRFNLLSGPYGDQNRAAIAEHPCPFNINYDSLYYSKLLEDDIKQDVFDAIIKNRQAPESVAYVISKLETADILNNDNIHIILKEISDNPNPKDVFYALERLRSANLLNSANKEIYLKVVCGHEFSRCIASILNTLDNTSVFSVNFIQNNIARIVKHPEPINLRTPLRILRNCNLLTEEMGQNNFDKLLSYPESKNLSAIFYALSSLLDQEYGQEVFDKLIERPSLLLLNNAVQLLSEFNLLKGDLGKETFNFILDVSIQDPELVARGICIFFKVGLLNEENSNFLKTHENLAGLVNAMTKLYIKGLLTGEQGTTYVESLMQSPEPEVVVNSILNRTFDASNPSRFFGVVSPEQSLISTHNESHQPNI